LLTPFYTPALPYNRLQIVYFFIAIVIALTLWRLAYISLISSPRFYKRILLIGNKSDALSLSEALEKSDPNFKIIGFIYTGNGVIGSIDLPDIQVFTATDIKETVLQQSISEVVVS